MTQNRQNSLQIYNTIDSTAERRNSESPNFKKTLVQANCVSGWIGRFFSWPTFTSSWDCVISAWEGFSLSPFWGEEYNQRHRRPFF